MEITKWTIPASDLHKTTIEILRHRKFEGTLEEITNEYMSAFNEVFSRINEYNKTATGTYR